jgi:hypothetical protein
VSSGAGTFSWVLFLPFSLVFGALARSHGVYWAGWVLVGVVAALALLFVFSTRAAPVHVDADMDDTPRQPPTADAVPADMACRELVWLLSDYLDGVLDLEWRTRADEHLRHCDGCTGYLDQIRTTVDLLAQLEGRIQYPAEETTT